MCEQRNKDCPPLHAPQHSFGRRQKAPEQRCAGAYGRIYAAIKKSEPGEQDWKKTALDATFTGESRTVEVHSGRKAESIVPRIRDVVNYVA